MPVPADLRYAESHEWILTTDDGIGTVGITDHAQNELTDIVFVELPQIGAKATKGSPIAVVESVKAASDIYAPASGEIVEVNGELSSNPALVNTDPYTNGWLFKIKLSDPAELESLKNAAEYEAQIG